MCSEYRTKGSAVLGRGPYRGNDGDDERCVCFRRRVKRQPAVNGGRKKQAVEMKRDTLVEEDIREPATHEISSTNVSISQQNSARLKEGSKKHEGMLQRAYEGFLELPVPVVLGAMWLMGVALMGLSALALYLLWLSLKAVAGA